MKKDQKIKAIGINLKEEMVIEIEQRSASMNLSVSRYCKIILSNWLTSDQKLQLIEK